MSSDIRPSTPRFSAPFSQLQRWPWIKKKAINESFKENTDAVALRGSHNHILMINDYIIIRSQSNIESFSSILSFVHLLRCIVLPFLFGKYCYQGTDEAFLGERALSFCHFDLKNGPKLHELPGSYHNQKTTCFLHPRRVATSMWRDHVSYSVFSLEKLLHLILKAWKSHCLAEMCLTPAEASHC